MSLRSLLPPFKHSPYVYSFLIGLCLFTNTNYAAPSLKICHEASNYPPYIYQEDNQSKGLLVDIIDEAAQNMKLHIEFDAKPWKRCQKDVQTGNSHALFAMIKTPKRAKDYAFPSDPSRHLWTAKYPIFTNKNTPFVFNDYSPSKGLGAPLGYVVWQKLKDRGWLSPFQYSPEEGLKMVAMGKLDGYVVERLIGLHLLYENQLTDSLSYSEDNLLDTIWYLPFNKSFYQSNKDLIENFWKALNEAREQFKQQYDKSKLAEMKPD